MKTNSETDAKTGQISTTAAEVYEEFFVPALFAQWVGPMLDAVDAHRGDRVIDIGTGTGVVARAALRRAVAPGGHRTAGAVRRHRRGGEFCGARADRHRDSCLIAYARRRV